MKKSILDFLRFIFELHDDEVPSALAVIGAGLSVLMSFGLFFGYDSNIPWKIPIFFMTAAFMRILAEMGFMNRTCIFLAIYNIRNGDDMLRDYLSLIQAFVLLVIGWFFIIQGFQEIGKYLIG